MSTVRSMTGYGCNERAGEHGRIRIEIRSVNHRFLEIQLNLPSFLMGHEPDLRTRIGRHIRRARVDVFVGWERVGGGHRVRVDPHLATEVYRALSDLRAAIGAAGEVPLDILTRFPEVIRIEAQDSALEPAALGELEACLDQALAEHDRARHEEGRALVTELRSRIDELGELVEAASTSSSAEPQRIAERIRERVAGLLVDNKLDPQRLHEEVAYVADRADVSEELTRLRVHIERARKLLDEESEVGKPLDFLVQELGREANTLGSKSRSTDTAGQVLAMKAVIEKIREQARNLE